MEERTVRVEPQLYQAAAELVRATGAFGSVEEYVNFVLAELLRPEQQLAADQAEQKALEQRLEQLGYA